MKTKVRILSSVLMVALMLTLSSCFPSDLGMNKPFGDGDENSNSEDDAYINVEGGDSYEITISTNESTNILAASKALLSSVIVRCTSGEGSGVIYDIDKNSGDAYIITNYHVVYDSSTSDKISKSIQIYLYGSPYGQVSENQLAKYAIPATYIGGTMYYDLAVLKIDASKILMESSAIKADIADSNKVSVLETAIAIGNAKGEGISATLGHVNVDSENIVMLSADNQSRVTCRVMRIDTAVNSGNSGGGLFNDRGELIGIVNAKMADTTVDNIGYAIPSNVVKGVVDNIVYYYRNGKADKCVYRCMLGISVTVNDAKAVYNTETGKVNIYEEIVITEVTSGSLVKDYLKKGDIINSITIDGNKHEVVRTHNVIDSMLNARVGSSVIMNITRDGQTFDVTIPITEEMLTAY